MSRGMDMIQLFYYLCTVQCTVNVLVHNILCTKLSLFEASGVARGVERPPQNQKILKGWGTAHASTSSEPRKQKKIQIFVNIVLIFIKIFLNF